MDKFNFDGRARSVWLSPALPETLRAQIAGELGEYRSLELLGPAAEAGADLRVFAQGAESAAREVFEEAGISLEPAALVLIDIMSYETGRGTAHTIIYNGDCSDGAEAAINEEHIYHRWMTPEAYIARFLDEPMLRARSASESAITLANEVARVVRAAAAARA
jgi:8-oxo-dGTP pyrophosphatase MutT (NUDIX family)